MSSDEESRQRHSSQMQDFQSLVLPPVPRPPNLQHSPDVVNFAAARRPVTSSTRGQHSSEPYPKPSNKGGVRGRVTVVCAECKRLKLRCSRDRPCTSCIKRACTDRCRYRNDEQPLPSIPAGDHHRSIVPTTNTSDNVYRLVSTNCVQCSNANSKCDRREPCSQCIKQHNDCHYPGLQPLTPHIDPNVLHHTLARLERLERRLGEIITPECDQCLELHLKCDGNGRNPCSWCLNRHSGGASAGQEAGLNPSPPNQQHGGGGAPGSGSPCTYSSYAEQAQRQGLHSPQSSLHANYVNGSRDRSPYAPRISSPPPPSSSHSTASGTTEMLGRVQAVENVVNNYSRTHNSNYSHGHSLSHGSVTSATSATYGATYPSTSTLTPITPSHPSSLHHYVTSPGTGTHQHHHSHSHSHSAHHPYPQADSQHQRTSSRHSPTQHLLTPHGQGHEQAPYHPQPSSEHRQDGPRSRGPSFSGGSGHRSQGSNAPTGFGSNPSSKHIKMPTPPGSINASTNGPPSAGTKLPEISNILTLLSPAPMSSNSDGKSPIPFPTPVSGVVGGTHERNFSLGGGASIQHLQSDVRGSSGEGSRRGSTSDQRDDLPSPSNNHLPSLQPSGSRPGSSSEALKSGLVDGIHSSRNDSYQQQPRRISNASMHGDEKHAPFSHSRTTSMGVSKREEEDDDMAEVDEIENDIDA